MSGPLGAGTTRLNRRDQTISTRLDLIEVGKLKLWWHVVFGDHNVDETMVEVNLGEWVVMMRMDRSFQDFVDTGKRNHDLGITCLERVGCCPKQRTFLVDRMHRRPGKQEKR